MALWQTLAGQPENKEAADIVSLQPDKHKITPLPSSIVFQKNILTLVGAYPCGRPVGQAQGIAPTQKHYLKNYTSIPLAGDAKAIVSNQGDTIPSQIPTPSSPAQVNQPLPGSCEVSRSFDSLAVTTPILSPISFATRQDDNGWPLDAALQFTTTVTRVQAFLGYDGMRNGMTWERVWYFGDQEMLSWPAKVGHNGIADIVAGQVAYPVVEQ